MSTGELLRKVSRGARRDHANERVVVVGDNVDEFDLAAMWVLRIANAGYDVDYVQVDHTMIDAARARVVSAADRTGWQTALPRVRVDRSLADVRSPLMIIEVVGQYAAESLAMKRRVFADLGARFDEKVVLVTTMSGRMGNAFVEDIAEGVPNQRRVIGLDFFADLRVSGILSVVSTATTSPAVRKRVKRFVRSLGLMPVDLWSR